MPRRLRRLVTVSPSLTGREKVEDFLNYLEVITDISREKFPAFRYRGLIDIMALSDNASDQMRAKILLATFIQRDALAKKILFGIFKDNVWFAGCKNLTPEDRVDSFIVVNSFLKENFYVKPCLFEEIVEVADPDKGFTISRLNQWRIKPHCNLEEELPMEGWTDEQKELFFYSHHATMKHASTQGNISKKLLATSLEKAALWRARVCTDKKDAPVRSHAGLQGMKEKPSPVPA